MTLTADTAFKVQDGPGYRGALYTLRPIDAETAAHFGCPGADRMLIGHHGHILGRMTEVTGKLVRVPGWTAARKGVLAVFTPWGSTGPDTGQQIKGWIGEPV